jgi:hypothetical protein
LDGRFFSGLGEVSFSAALLTGEDARGSRLGVADISKHFAQRLYPAVDAADKGELPARFCGGALSGASVD